MFCAYIPSLTLNGVKFLNPKNEISGVDHFTAQHGSIAKDAKKQDGILITSNYLCVYTFCCRSAQI
jgi:hypothetical protein